MIGVILAGGENRRIPALKGFLSVEGKAIIERSIDTLTRILGKTVISTNMPEKYFCFGLPLIGDITQDKGPIIGILSVLAATGEDSVFVVACDMPFVSGKLVRYMVESFRGKMARDAHVDAVIPVFEGKTEPLFGIYTRRVLPTIEDMLQNGRKGLIAMLEDLNVQYLTDQEVRAEDPKGASFVNINTMEDYERIGGKTCLV
ncbi:MAG TPA: molybdenum cofactor guanylyltransferase [Thermodesulfovibrionales bacterium]|nr:molybdenum cofactor guanylyltransferase [Thermodesulfovibrionales bacterium]